MLKAQKGQRVLNEDFEKGMKTAQRVLNQGFEKAMEEMREVKAQLEVKKGFEVRVKEVQGQPVQNVGFEMGLG